jgi:hypothetical protein
VHRRHQQQQQHYRKQHLHPPLRSIINNNKYANANTNITIRMIQCLVVSLLLITFGSIWIMIHYLDRPNKSNLIVHNDDHPLFLLRKRSINNNKKVAAFQFPSLAQQRQLLDENGEEVIDMRIWNDQLRFDNPDGGAWKQGWDVQPKNRTTDRIEIFVVPHSHNDPGWIQTFDQYFRKQTSTIITTVIQSLMADPRRTFIWAEISYFAWWWQEQQQQNNATMMQAVRTVLDRGQLEFVTGGWVQTDEANSQLYAMEIQLQEGHDWIREHLGPSYVPKYGWAIDPFGYSPTNAYLQKIHHFQAILIQRVHYVIKRELALRQHLEFFWRQTWDHHQNDTILDTEQPQPQPIHTYDIFTHVMPFYSYDIPHTCGPDPSICCQFDFARMKLPPGAWKADSCPWKKEPVEITNDNVAQRASMLLDQYLKKAALYRSNAVLIPLGDDFRYRSIPEAEAQYRNYQKLFDYINANHPDVHVKFGTLSQYFETARKTFHGKVPILKGSFFTYSDVNQDYWSGYFTSRVFDKALDRRLERALFAAESMNATRMELREARRALSLFQHHDGVTGTARDHVVEDYAQRLYNAMDHVHTWIIRHIQHKHANWIQDMVGEGDIQPCWMSPKPRGMPENLCGNDILLFNPLTTEQSCGDVVVPGHQLARASWPCESTGPTRDSATRFVFDPRTGLMQSPIREEWRIWKVKAGGAYLFVPDVESAYDASNHKLRISENGFVVHSEYWNRTIVEKQVPTEFGGKATVIDFIYETEINEGNREWFVRFHSDIANNGIFYTDLNGFNFDTHHFRSDMPIQSQVFPMPTLACIQAKLVRMTVISEHAQGTASLRDGAIDVWLDRRLRQDDNRGLGQGVLDNRPLRSRFRVVLEQEFDYDMNGDFRVTPLVRRMWDELQHPLYMFGKHRSGALEEITRNLEAVEERLKKARLDQNSKRDQHGLVRGQALEKNKKRALPPPPPREITNRAHSMENTIVPFVFLVYKRVDYFKLAIESLKDSDFPRDRVPIIVSVDGHVPEMIDFVETLRDDGFDVELLVHPFSCHDHPNSFPGNDPTLNEGYKGDAYGSPRSWQVTCCKHHFTWLLQSVFSIERLKNVVTFLFTEEGTL